MIFSIDTDKSIGFWCLEAVSATDFKSTIIFRSHIMFQRYTNIVSCVTQCVACYTNIITITSANFESWSTNLQKNKVLLSLLVSNFWTAIPQVHMAFTSFRLIQAVDLFQMDADASTLEVTSVFTFQFLTPGFQTIEQTI